MTDEEIRSLFLEMRDDPLPADSLARIRSGVAARMAESRWWSWLIPLSLAAGILAVVSVLVFLRPLPPVEAPPVRVASMQPPVSVSEPSNPVPSKMRPNMRPKAHHSSSDSGTVVRIETDDPNVVILLVGE